MTQDHLFRGKEPPWGVAGGRDPARTSRRPTPLDVKLAEDVADLELVGGESPWLPVAWVEEEELDLNSSI